MTSISEKPSQKLSATEKKALLTKRLKRTKSKASQSPRSIPLRTNLGPAPLSFSQEGLWYLEQLQPDTATYHMPLVWHIHGGLDIPALEHSLKAIVERHEILRTSFTIDEGGPVQVIASKATIKLKIVHLAEDEANDACETQLQSLINAEVQRPFDLTQAPLFRASLLKLSPNKYILILTLHHIVGDGWSLDILKRELSEFYKAFSTTDAGPSLPELPIQYADFATWQRDKLQTEGLEKHVVYWRQKLAGAPAVLELPTDYLRPPIQDYTGQRVDAELSPALYQSLKDLSNTENTTLFMTLLACFKLLMYRYSGQNDLVVGTPMINRNQVETEGLIGYFLNNLALRTYIDDEHSFRQFLRQVRETTLEAYQHQDLPFEKLIEDLEPDRDLSYTPIFQVFFNMMVSNAASEPNLAGLTVEPLQGFSLERGSKFDLTLYVRGREDKITFSLVYKSSLFSPERMTALLDQYQYLLTQIVQNPDRLISAYSLVRSSDLKILPNQTERLSAGWAGSVFAQFSKQAAQQPHHQAILDPQDTWTYQELETRSNQLAQYLHAHNIQPGDVVAVYGQRSASLVWAWLGILKAGAAFVNLDPAYPPERLLHYLHVATPKGLVDIEGAGSLPPEVAEQVDAFNCRVTLPALSKAIKSDPFADVSTAPLGVTVGPDDVAYIAFTSGSTGQPKGVMGRHGSLSHFIPWQMETFGLSANDKFSLLSGLAHDPLQRDIFTALWVGATICIPDPEKIGISGYLADWMAQAEVTFMHITPPMCQILTETAATQANLPHLRYAFFVGDKLTQQDVRQLQHLAPQIICINSYGSTETQRAVGYQVIPPAEKTSQALSPKAVYPLGRGMPDVQLLVLNKAQELAGISEVGEIYVRSPHLARGYLGDEALTKTHFLVNRLTGQEGDRLYRTGDLGRYRPDGVVEFAGRADRQIKIRGFRIEPGEIETALKQHPDIQEAVVTSVTPPASIYLAVYYVPHSTKDPSVTALRVFLKERVPDYMVPAAFVRLAAIPLTPNGKIDYQNLPATDSHTIEHAREIVTAQTPVEQQLVTIWQELLNVDQVSIHDNFFDLGGHSLLAIQLLTRLNQTFQRDITLAALFQVPTIAQLGQVLTVEAATPSHLTASLVAVRTEGNTVPIFCIPGNLGNVFTDLGPLVTHLDATMPFYGFQDGVHNPTKIETVASHYVAEMQTVQPEGPYHLAGICSGGTIAFEMAQQLQEQGQKVEFLALIEPAYPSGSKAWGIFDFFRLLGINIRRRFWRHAGDFGDMAMVEQRSYVGMKRKLMANLWALRQYVPQAYHGSLDLFLTTTTLNQPHNPRLKWQQFATSGSILHEIPGDHDTITGTGEIEVNETHMKVVAEQINARLNGGNN